MAASSQDPPVTNLATLLLIKRRIGSKDNKEPDVKLAAPLPAIGAHSDERITYHQNAPVEKPPEPTTKTNDQTKGTRKTKQLEVTQLDQKMEEINRRQEKKTNAALDSWKGFDSLNYGFVSTPGTAGPTPAPPVSAKQHTPKPPPQRELTPVKPQSAENRPISAEPASARDQSSPIQVQSPEEQPTSERLNTPPQGRSIPSQSSHPTSAKSKSPLPAGTTEQIVPISAITSDPQIFHRHSQPIEKSPASISSDTPLKRFPDIKQYEMKKSRKGARSIQRSMDRYRFHVW